MDFDTDSSLDDVFSDDKSSDNVDETSTDSTPVEEAVNADEPTEQADGLVPAAEDPLAASPPEDEPEVELVFDDSFELPEDMDFEVVSVSVGGVEPVEVPIDGSTFSKPESVAKLLLESPAVKEAE